MIYYIDDANQEVYAYDRAAVDAGYVKESLRAMSADEVNAHLNPPPSYWTDGARLEYSERGPDQWWLASQQEIDSLLPAVLAGRADDKVRELRAVADAAIAPLQDALDIDESTAAEEALLKLWKRYRVALNRLPEQPGYPTTIDWPAPPA